MKKILLNTSLLLGLALTFTACSDDDDDNGIASVQPIEITYGENYQVDGASNITIANDFIATASGNTITAKHAGQTTATIDGKEYPVVIKETSEAQIIDEPITEWGVDEAYVKQHQTQGTLDGESPDSLHYVNAGQALELTYYFSDGKLTNVTTRATRNIGRACIIKLNEWLNQVQFPEQYYFNVGDYYYIDADNIDDAKTIGHWAEITSWSYNYYYEKSAFYQKVKV